MEFRVLGPIEVCTDAGALDLGGPKPRAVLARLLAAHRQPVSAERIIEDVWQDASGATGAGVLQGYVSTLRRQLEPHRPPRSPARLLRTTPNGYLLDVTTDADDFAAAVETGVRLTASGAPDEAAQLLADALALWRGQPYGDVADANWLAPELTRLAELRLVAEQHRLAALISTGRAHAAVPDLERLLAEHPLHEELARLLALALYRTARQADALAVLDRTRGRLREDLGLDPSAPLRELETAILTQSDELGRAEIVVTSRPTAPVFAAPPPTADELVGRGQLLAELLELAHATADGAPRAALLTGEPGVGKTAVAEALSRRLQDAGWQVAMSACFDTTGAPALWPWLRILAELDDRHPVPPELHELIDAAPTGSAADGRFRQQQAVRDYLARICAERPLLLVFDDVQWADAASLHLLADVVSLGRQPGLCLVVLMRPMPPHDALTRLVPARTLRRRIDRLSDADVAELARQHDRALSDADVHALAQRSGGNPFFALELLRLRNGRSGAGSSSTVPDSVHDLVAQLVGKLSPEAQTVLRVAAVLGREIDPDLLADVGGEDPDDVWDALDAAVLAGLITGEERFRFVHDLVRESLLADVPPLRRSRLHARTVAALEARGGLDSALIAEHARAAGPLAREAAIRWATRAAEQATARWAHEDAVRWREVARAASEAAGRARTPQHVELLLGLVRAQLAAGDAIGARDTRNHAVEASAYLDDPVLTARALVALDAPTLWQLRQFDELEQLVVDQLEATLAVWPETDDPLRCRLMATLGAELYGAVPDPRSVPLVDAAVAMARRLGDRRVLAYALNCAVFARARAHHADEVAAIAAEVLELAAELHDPELELLGHQLTAADALRRFDVQRADVHARRADELVRRLELGVPRLHQVTYWLGRAQLDGRFAVAEAALDELAALPLRWWAREPLIAGMRVMSAILQGRLAEVADLLPIVAEVQPSLAADASRLLGRDVTAPWPPVPYDWGWLALLTIRALAAAAAGTDDIRREVLAQLAPFAGQIATTSGLATPVDWYLAVLARSLGDEAAARRHLAALREATERAGLAAVDWPAAG